MSAIHIGHNAGSILATLCVIVKMSVINLYSTLLYNLYYAEYASRLEKRSF